MKYIRIGLCRRVHYYWRKAKVLQPTTMNVIRGNLIAKNDKIHTCLIRIWGETGMTDLKIWIFIMRSFLRP